MAKTKIPLSEKKVTKEGDVIEEEVVVAEPPKKNDFVIYNDPKWPSMCRVKRERGQVPAQLNGLFTNSYEAQKAINVYKES